MNELDILKDFYAQMRERGVSRNDVFINIDETTLARLNSLQKTPATLEEARKLTDICIANEWLERTTIDPNYNFLSLTEAGLQVVIAIAYQ